MSKIIYMNLCSKKRMSEGCLVLASICLTIFLAESALEIYNISRKSRSEINYLAAKEKGLPFDRRLFQQFAQDEQIRWPQLVKSFVPIELVRMRKNYLLNNLNPFLLGNISNRWTALCNESGSYVVFKPDRYGFRNFEATWPSNVDIITLGDSFVEGECLALDESLFGIIHKVHPRSVNLGKRGTGPLSQLAILKEYGLHLKAKKLLWFFYEKNDLTDLRDELKIPQLKAYLSDQHSNNLLKHQKEAEQALEQLFSTLDNIKPSTKKFNLIDVFFLRNIRSLFPKSIKLYPLSEFNEISQKISLIAKENKVQLYFVYIPSYETITGKNTFQKIHHKIIQIIDEKKIPLIDLTPLLSQIDVKEIFPFGLPNHFNEKGYQLVGEEVLRRIEPTK